MGVTVGRNGPAIRRRIAASPASVWRVLVDLDAWPRWGPSVARAELDEVGALRFGATGRVWAPFGVALPFVITEFQDGLCWAWRVAGLAATRHEVRPVAGGAELRFEVPWWAPAYLGVCAVALRRIDRLARHDR